MNLETSRYSRRATITIIELLIPKYSLSLIMAIIGNINLVLLTFLQYVRVLFQISSTGW